MQFDPGMEYRPDWGEGKSGERHLRGGGGVGAGGHLGGGGGKGKKQDAS